MANTLTNVNGVLTVQVVEALKLGLTPLKVFSLGVGSDPAQKNATINVPVITALTADTNQTDYESGDTTIASAQVSVGTNISKTWHLTAVQSSKSEIVDSMWNAMAVEATYAVAYAAQLAALELITATSYTNSDTVATAAALDFAEVLSHRAYVLGTLKWRENGMMSLVANHDYAAGLFADPAVAMKSASGMDIAIAGKSTKVAGFDVYENGVIGATTTPASENLKAFYVRPDAMAIAVRPPEILGTANFIRNEIISDPAGSGVSLNYREWVSPKGNTRWGCVEILFGAIKVNGASLYRVKSA